MMKIFQKLKKWLAGILAVQLLIAIMMPTLVTAETAAETVTVSSLSTTDTTPVLRGSYGGSTITGITITVDGASYQADLASGVWTANVNSALLPGTYDVQAVTSGSAIDNTEDELVVLADAEAPTLVSADTYSNNVSPNWAKVGDKVFVQITASEAIDGPNVLINGRTAYVTGEGTDFEAYRVMDANDTEGVVSYSIDFSDLAGNQGVPLADELSNVTFDSTAPVVLTAQEYGNRQPNTLMDAEHNLVDGGVYIQEENNFVTVQTEWALAAEATEGSARTYEVVYHVTDLAGNLIKSDAVKVELTEDAVEASGSLPISLLGEDVLDHERGELYLDAGASVENWESEFVHVWAYGDLDLAKTGDYELGYGADETEEMVPTGLGATVLEQEARSIKVVDTEGPEAVTNLKAASGNGYVQLTWSNPSDDDFAGLDIYRSTKAGDLGVKIAGALSTETVSYDDYTVINEVAYYYTVIAFDFDGNNAESQQVAGAPHTPRVAVTTVSYYDDGSQDVAEEQDVKSDDTQSTVEVEDETNVPVIGIIILVLLIVLGIYLLYLQNPSWFDWAFFWKRKKVAAKIKTKKK